MDPRLPSLRQPPIGFAHRGARAHAPENTLEAFRLALRLGATGLETDIWLTSDGEAVLDHDGRHGRRPFRKPISAVSRVDLADHVPTLAELYEECGTGFELSIDVKDPEAIHEILDVARRFDAEARLWLCHPDVDTVASWRELTSCARLVHSTRLQALAGGPERHAARLQADGIDAMNMHHTDWTGGRVVMFHRFGRYALGWDAQFDRIIAELIRMGIDGIFSDHTDRLTEKLASWTPVED